MSPIKITDVWKLWFIKQTAKMNGCSFQILGTLEILKIALRLRYRHVFMWQSVEILNVFNTLTLKNVFWKMKSFSKKLEYHFFSWKHQDWKRIIPCIKSWFDVPTTQMFIFILFVSVGVLFEGALTLSRSLQYYYLFAVNCHYYECHYIHWY